jgi:hypothetical protein
VQIVVGAQVAGDRPDRGEVVFALPWDPARPDAGPTDGADLFDRSFYSPPASAEVDGIRHGMVSRTRLPNPVDGTWSFYLRYDDDPDHLVAINPTGGRLRVPDVAPGEKIAERAEYVATLDEDWQLAVHRVEIPYREAKTLAGMWENPGSVLEVAISGSPDGPVEAWDPFSGTQ